MRVIVTSGGTEEAIDGVRRITNVSTGATGAVIARTFAERGAEVLLLHAKQAKSEPAELECETFVTHADLEAGLKRHLGGRAWDAVIHVAAVSDYSIAAIEIDGVPAAHGNDGKIASGHDVVIRLKSNPKLIDGLKRWSRNGSVQVVGFKLTNTPDPAVRAADVQALLARGTTDLVVHNDLNDIEATRHPAEIWSAGGPIVRTETKEELALALFDLLRRGGDDTRSEEKNR